MHAERFMRKIVVIIHSLTSKQLKNLDNNVYELAIPMYERILGSLASLEIWGS